MRVGEDLDLVLVSGFGRPGWKGVDGMSDWFFTQCICWQDELVLEWFDNGCARIIVCSYKSIRSAYSIPPFCHYRILHSYKEKKRY